MVDSTVSGVVGLRSAATALQVDRDAAAAQVVVVRAAEIDDAGCFDLDDARRDRRDELAVMAHEDHRAGIVLERQVQRLDRLHVEVVRRLVHEDDVRPLQHDLAEQHAAALATRELVDGLLHLVAAEQEAAERRANRLIVVAR